MAKVEEKSKALCEQESAVCNLSNAVENCPKWYALKLFYNRTKEIGLYTERLGCELYIPLRRIKYSVAGREVKRQIPAISSLAFIKSTKEQILTLKRELQGRVMVYGDPKSREPKHIEDEEMRVFRLVTEMDENFECVDIATQSWMQGDRVRVKDGLFKGAEGYIHRIKGNRRLIVAIEGVVAVATSYIPAKMLEKIQ